MLGEYPAQNSFNLAKRKRAAKFCTKQFPQGFHSWAGYSKVRKPLKKDLFSGQNSRFSDHRAGVTLAEIGGCRSNRSRSAQHSRGKEKEGSQKRQNAVHSDPRNAKRQQKHPNNGINHQSKQRERPTKKEQDAPQKERNHGNPLTFYYARARVEVPSIEKVLSLSLRAIETGTSASSNM